MKIAYFGSDVHLTSFRYLLQKHQVLALYTYHNDEDYFTEYSIVRLAMENNIPVHYELISEGEMVDLFRRDGCELVFVAEYDRLLPVPEELTEFRGVNIHASLLPQGRSYYPIELALSKGLARTGVTMHKLTAALDGGEILAQREFSIDPEWDSVDLYLHCGACGREMTEEVLSNLEERWKNAAPRETVCPYWNRPEDGQRILRHDMCRAQALELFRCFNKMTLVTLQGELYYVTDMTPSVVTLPEEGQDEIAVDYDRYLYRLTDGHLRLHVKPVKGTEI